MQRFHQSKGRNFLKSLEHITRVLYGPSVNQKEHQHKENTSRYLKASVNMRKSL